MPSVTGLPPDWPKHLTVYKTATKADPKTGETVYVAAFKLNKEPPPMAFDLKNIATGLDDIVDGIVTSFALKTLKNLSPEQQATLPALVDQTTDVILEWALLVLADRKSVKDNPKVKMPAPPPPPAGPAVE